MSAGPRVRPGQSQGILWALAAAWLLAGTAYDDRSVSAPPAHVCQEAGAQCPLAAGPLGVCERTRCDTGETPPCFVCVPQH